MNDQHYIVRDIILSDLSNGNYELLDESMLVKQYFNELIPTLDKVMIEGMTIWRNDGVDLFEHTDKMCMYIDSGRS